MVKYRYQMPEGESVWVTPSVGRDVSSSTSNFGGANATLDIASTVFGLRAGWRGRLGPHVVVTAGLDLEASMSDLARQGAVTTPPREGDVHVFGQVGPDKVGSDAWRTTLGSVAPYAQVDVTLFDDRLHVVPGLRVEPYLIAGSRLTPAQGNTPAIGFSHEDTAIEPRLSARFSPIKTLTLKAAWGIYHQAPQAEDLSAQFGNPNLTIASANHVLGGVTYSLTDTLVIEGVGFYSRSKSLVSRSDAATPLLAQALVNEGEGRAYGGQLILRQALARGFFGWASYSLIRSERQDHVAVDAQPATADHAAVPGRTGSGWRAFDSDQTHVLTLVASYEPGLGFELGARFRYTSGFPRTPVVGAFYDARRDVYEPYFGAQSSARIPSFVSLDLRVAKRFDLGRVKLEVYLDVQNVTNKKNAEDLVYSYDYRKQSTISGLPILPVLGARLDY